MEFNVSNVNEAFSEALYYLTVEHVTRSSRNGPVWEFPEPVITNYKFPMERILFSPLRDANPFFHLFEAIWMMAGRNDIAFPAQFNKHIASFSDDDVTMPSAYGHRWRKWFGFDQLQVLVKELQNNPETRRAVLTMWDASSFDWSRPEEFGKTGDLAAVVQGSKDVPCNTHIYFDRRNDQLNMTVCNRSNDLWWGAYGANAVHFSVLQEWMAFAIGCPVGWYRQFSNNLHLYTEVVDMNRLKEYATDAEETDHYLWDDDMNPFPLVKVDAWQWLQEAEMFCTDPLAHPWRYTEPFFATIAVPLYTAWRLRKDKEPAWIEALNSVAPSDWKVAATEWINRRETARSKVG